MYIQFTTEEPCYFYFRFKILCRQTFIGKTFWSSGDLNKHLQVGFYLQSGEDKNKTKSTSWLFIDLKQQYIDIQK